MIIKYMTPGAETKHVPFEAEGNSVTIDGTLTLQLDRYEAEEDRHIDICRDRLGGLTIGVIPGWSLAYVAQIEIPARSYHEVDGPEEIEEGIPSVTREAAPYDPEKTTLVLWEKED